LKTDDKSKDARRRLRVKKEPLRQLSGSDLEHVIGGGRDPHGIVASRYCA
jgi:hypothetical protein